MLGDSNANGYGRIKFVAVARADDGKLVASYLPSRADSDVEKYHHAVHEVLCAPDFQHKVKPGSRYRLVGDINAFNFTTDTQQCVYIVITVANFSEKFVFPLINELIPAFKDACGDEATSCEEGALSKKVEPSFARLVRAYDNPSSDKIASLQAKVGDIAVSVGDSIGGALRNINKAEQLEEQTMRLQDEAELFHKQTNQLKRHEQWRKWKMNIVIGGILLLIIVIIIVALASR
ncbi:Vesicle-associated membrane protein, putative [Hondaea fermentalgiana]|uniref:Vesicle-associated membrane protein, putative n=1 Tax=Hondaea fermentalgiana TaxID=2315210 RepID=A0A2R5GKQ6_9STRA|nr:Vesicle-associated membrane protein, putative [Hondaea fermentalgiana]|eukprot:GBG31460.1 Vesicle-associated membrane protein, putative [Hondaea fermentalgiana]